MRCVAAALAVALLGAAGCSRPAGGAWIPQVPGAVWVYELRSEDRVSEVRVKALGEREVPGRAEPVFLMEETRSGGGRFDAVNPVGYVVQDGYTARLGGLAYDGTHQLVVLGDGSATRVLPLDPQPGAHWTQETRIFPAADGIRQLWEVEVRGRDAIEVPCGSFEDVVELETTLRDGSGVVRGRYTDVFARGVGLVYGVARDLTGDTPYVEEMRLLRYDVPDG